jgi:hypothetical protein
MEATRAQIRIKPTWLDVTTNLVTTPSADRLAKPPSQFVIQAGAVIP